MILRDHEPAPPRFFWLVCILGVLVGGSILIRPVETGVSRLERAGPSSSGSDAEAGAGARLYIASGCGECHTTAGADSALGPVLAGAGTRAEARINATDYSGSATSARDYLVEAIVDHCADRLPGYACPELSSIALQLSVEDAELLAGFIEGLPGDPAP